MTCGGWFSTDAGVKGWSLRKMREPEVSLGKGKKNNCLRNG